MTYAGESVTPEAMTYAGGERHAGGDDLRGGERRRRRR